VQRPGLARVPVQASWQQRARELVRAQQVWQQQPELVLV
jgi:hypothetical protein